MTPEEISRYVRLRSVDCGGCLHWYSKARSQQRLRHPLVYIEGVQQLARRVLYESEVGPLTEDQYLAPDCGDERCMEPEHQKVLTRRQKDLMGARLGGRSTTRAASVGRTRLERGMTKLTPEIAAEIRASDETGRALARRYGVNEKTVSDVRNWRTWKNIGGANPFAGLGV